MGAAVLASAGLHLLRAGLVRAEPAAAAPAESGAFPETVRSLEGAYYGELLAHLHYRSFERVALLEGYPGIAHLFAALGISEWIHALKFQLLLHEMGSPLGRTPALEVSLAPTRANLAVAAERELEKIDDIYPRFAEAIRVEGHTTALRYTTYAWESHRQHRGHIAKIDRWVGVFFGTVAKRLEAGESRYFVCSECGSTVSEVPPESCAICHLPNQLYSAVEQPA